MREGWVEIEYIYGRCRHCNESIAARADAQSWFSATTDNRASSITCRVGRWHAPYDLPESLEPEQVEAWLAQPLVID